VNVHHSFVPAYSLAATIPIAIYYLLGKAVVSIGVFECESLGSASHIHHLLAGGEKYIQLLQTSVASFCESTPRHWL